jgi:hypothetical protein
MRIRSLVTSSFCFIHLACCASVYSSEPVVTEPSFEYLKLSETNLNPSGNHETWILVEVGSEHIGRIDSGVPTGFIIAEKFNSYGEYRKLLNFAPHKNLSPVNLQSIKARVRYYGITSNPQTKGMPSDQGRVIDVANHHYQLIFATPTSGKVRPDVYRGHWQFDQNETVIEPAGRFRLYKPNMEILPESLEGRSMKLIFSDGTNKSLFFGKETSSGLVDGAAFAQTYTDANQSTVTFSSNLGTSNYGTAGSPRIQGMFSAYLVLDFNGAQGGSFAYHEPKEDNDENSTVYDAYLPAKNGSFVFQEDIWPISFSKESQDPEVQGLPETPAAWLGNLKLVTKGPYSVAVPTGYEYHNNLFSMDGILNYWGSNVTHTLAFSTQEGPDIRIHVNHASENWFDWGVLGRAIELPSGNPDGLFYNPNLVKDLSTFTTFSGDPAFTYLDYTRKRQDPWYQTVVKLDDGEHSDYLANRYPSVYQGIRGSAFAVIVSEDQAGSIALAKTLRFDADLLSREYPPFSTYAKDYDPLMPSVALQQALSPFGKMFMPAVISIEEFAVRIIEEAAIRDQTISLGSGFKVTGEPLNLFWAEKFQTDAGLPGIMLAWSQGDQALAVAMIDARPSGDADSVYFSSRIATGGDSPFQLGELLARAKGFLAVAVGLPWVWETNATLVEVPYQIPPARLGPLIRTLEAEGIRVAFPEDKNPSSLNRDFISWLQYDSDTRAQLLIDHYIWSVESGSLDSLVADLIVGPERNVLWTERFTTDSGLPAIGYAYNYKDQSQLQLAIYIDISSVDWNPSQSRLFFEIRPHYSNNGETEGTLGDFVAIARSLELVPGTFELETLQWDSFKIPYPKYGNLDGSFGKAGLSFRYPRQGESLTVHTHYNPHADTLTVGQYWMEYPYVQTRGEGTDRIIATVNANHSESLDDWSARVLTKWHDSDGSQTLPKGRVVWSEKFTTNSGKPGVILVQRKSGSGLNQDDVYEFEVLMDLSTSKWRKDHQAKFSPDSNVNWNWSLFCQLSGTTDSKDGFLGDLWAMLKTFDYRDGVPWTGIHYSEKTAEEDKGMTVLAPVSNAITVNSTELRVGVLLGSELEAGWLLSDWLGKFFEASNGWKYHETLGWVYDVGENEDSIWLWNKDLGWFWTGESIFPYLYLHEEKAWFYLSGESKKTAKLYDYQMGVWRNLLSWPEHETANQGNLEKRKFW